MTHKMESREFYQGQSWAAHDIFTHWPLPKYECRTHFESVGRQNTEEAKTKHLKMYFMSSNELKKMQTLLQNQTGQGIQKQF